VVLTTAFFASCTDQPTEPEVVDMTIAADARIAVRGGLKGCAGCAEDGIYSDALDAINVMLEAEGAEFRVAMAEFVTGGRDETPGMTVLARDVGNKKSSSDFVPNDPRRGGRSNLTYIVDGFDGATTSGPSSADTERAIDDAMATWDAETCSDLNMTKNATTAFDIGVIQAIFGFGGIPAFIPFADVIHGGWLPGGFFDALAPGGSNFILGVTFTLVFSSDINNDGKIDTAFREIYYNDDLGWGIDVPGFFPVFDVETVVLHEAGHGLSQGHFGKIFGTFANGRLHFSPEAVMNAAVFGQKQTLLGTDNGGHCSNWAAWPSN